MASSNETVSMALFCDFENVALGVRDAKYDKFDIKLVLERLLLKGSIVVKKAYCDWDRYKSFKGAMHEANFELIEIPHVRQSGKNSADIRLVVDALDLCYTKSHVNTFVIISGDSDFSPLVSKLRENAKQVIGVGVQQSTSDLLIANCDEFFFYDDLVRESQRTVAKRESSRPQQAAQQATKRAPDEEKTRNKEDLEKRRTKAVEIAVQTFDALASERGDSGKIWASVLKNAIKRRKPDFNETYYGFRAFGNLLEEAHARGLLEFGRDEKSGAYVYRSTAASVAGDGTGEVIGEVIGEVAAESGSESFEASGSAEQLYEAQVAETVVAELGGRHESRRRGRDNRKSGRGQQRAAHEERAPREPQEAVLPPTNDDHTSAAEAHRVELHEPEDERAPNASQDNASPPMEEAHVRVSSLSELFGEQPELALNDAETLPVDPTQADSSGSEVAPHEPNAEPKRGGQRSPRKTAAKNVRKGAQRTIDELPDASPDLAPSAEARITAVQETDTPVPAKKAARKTASRSRRPKKSATASDVE